MSADTTRLGIFAGFPVRRTLDIVRVGVVPLDQVAVVAVHRADEAGQRGQQAFGQGAPYSSRLRNEREHA